MLRIVKVCVCVCMLCMKDIPYGSDSEEFACHVGDLGSVPGLGRAPGREHGNPLQYSCLENPHGQRSLSSVQWFSHVWLFATPWTAALQASLSITNKTLCTSGLRKKEQWPHKRLSLWVSSSLRQRRGSTVACCEVSGTEYNSPGSLGACWHNSFWRRTAIAAITPTIVWPQAKLQGGEESYPSTENWIKDLLSMAPPIRARPRFPHSESLPSGSFHQPLILIHQRADRMKTTITEN